MPEIDLGSVVGPQGKQGDPGPEGKQGIQGPPGAPATINGVNALTVTAGPNVKLTQTGSSLEIGAVVPGKNLLLNGDFRRPVNRNGKVLYEGTSIFTIDCWSTRNDLQVLIGDGYIDLIPTGTSNARVITQWIDATKLVGKTVTFSVLYKEALGDLPCYIYLWANNLANGIDDYSGVNTVHNSTNGLLSITAVIPEGCDRLFGTIGFKNGSDMPIDNSHFALYAAVLEPGDHQTHFRQNADGEWELIDPPDYDLQYLLCSQYSPSTGEWVGLQHSNENLLDNACWANKKSIINQRALEEYVGNGYGIDRWRSLTAHITVNVLSNAIRLTSTNDYAAETSVYAQIMENPEWLIGRRVTLSFLVDGIYGNTTWRCVLRGSKNDTYVGAYTQTIGVGLTSLSVTIPATWDIDRLDFRINTVGKVTGSYIDLVAAKFELGPVQTLAHKEGDTWVLNDPPPNKALELAKCQRYQLSLNANVRLRASGYSNVYIDFWVPTPVPLRGNPSLPTTLAVTNTNGVIVSGFTFVTPAPISPNGFLVRAQKENHGMTDGQLRTTENYSVFDANL